MLIDSGGWINNGQEMFVSVYNAFEYFATQGKCTRVASYYGDTGTGMDYHDGANPAEEHAFAVYLWPSSATREFDFYVLIQYGHDACPTTGNGSPCSLGTNSALGTWLGMQVAVGVNILGSGAAQSITHVAGDTWALTDSTAAFTGAMVGEKVRITEASAELNNGRFVVTAVPSATSLQYTNTEGSVDTSCTWEVADATGLNPWNGTLLNNGTDAKGDPVWKDSSTSRVHVFPRCNAEGGSFSTDKSNLCASFYPRFDGNDATRAHIIADDDNIVMLRDEKDLANPLKHTFIGTVRELEGLDGDFALCMFAGITNQGSNTEYGPYNGSFTLEGGAYSPGYDTIVSLRVETYPFMKSSNYTPNLTYATPTYNEYPLDVYSSYGHLGELDFDFIRHVYGLTSLDTLSSATRLVVGYNTAAYSNTLYYTFPWDGSTDPRDAGATRVGVTF